MARSRNAVDELQPEAHPLLVMQRYPNFTEEGSDNGNASKHAFLRRVIRASTQMGEVYQQAYKRYEQSLDSRTAKGEFTVHGRMIIGLSTPSPLETGITLHHTYGTPIIPGTALKGLAAHYCDQVWGVQNSKFKKNPQENPTDQYHSILFGNGDGSGFIVFHDAWLKPECLDEAVQPDIITVHHQAYYQGKENAPPTDFDDPTPIPFLSVQGTFLIAVSPLCSDGLASDPRAKQWCRLALDLLTEALQTWGIGAKTNTGYGRIDTVR